MEENNKISIEEFVQQIREETIEGRVDLEYNHGKTLLMQKMLNRLLENGEDETGDEEEDKISKKKYKEQVQGLRMSLFQVAHRRYIHESDNLRYDRVGNTFYIYDKEEGIYSAHQMIQSALMNKMHEWNIPAMATRSKCGDVIKLMEAWCEPFEITVDKPWVLCVENGLIDLKTGKLSPHDPNYVTTKKIDVDYDPDFVSKEWEDFVHSFISDKEEMDYFHKFMGYALSGDTKQEVIMMLWGAGGNGKGVFFESVAGVMGDYYSIGNLASFTERFGLSAIHGKRLCVLNEPDDGRIKSEQLKLVTGGGEVSIEKKGKDAFAYLPELKLVITANHLPRIADTSKGMQRRLAIIQLKNTFANNASYKSKITHKDLRPAVLAWLVRGSVALQRDGGQLVKPKSIEQNVEDYREDSSTVASFFADRIIIDPEGSEIVKDLYTEFTDYAIDLGHRFTTGRKSFVKQFREEISVRDLDDKIAYIQKGRVNSGNRCSYGFVGLKMNNDGWI